MNLLNEFNMTDYVSLVGEKSVHVSAKEQKNISVIQAFDRVYDEGNDTWRISFSTEEELANILQRLSDSGIAFEGGPAGWPPATVAQWLRERGLMHGKITEILWRGRGRQPELRESKQTMTGIEFRFSLRSLRPSVQFAFLLYPSLTLRATKETLTRACT